MRDFGGRRSSTSDRDEQVAAARRGPGRRTLTEMLSQTGSPVQGKADAALEGKTDAAPARPAAPRASVANLFGPRAERQRSAGREPDAAPRPAIVEVSAADVQRKATGAEHDTEQIHASAQRGVATVAEPLPHGEQIQRLFGRHDVSGVQAHVGGDAARASGEIGAQAYAMGNHVAFAQAPDLRTAAHEAAHVVQQRGEVSLAGGVGESGDAHERHADQVAEQVARGASAEHLLDSYSPRNAGATSIQSVQMMKFKDIRPGRYYRVKTPWGTGTYYLKTKRSGSLTNGRGPEFTFVENEDTRGAYALDMAKNPSFVIRDNDQILAEVGGQTAIEVAAPDRGNPARHGQADEVEERRPRKHRREQAREKEPAPGREAGVSSGLPPRPHHMVDSLSGDVASASVPRVFSGWRRALGGDVNDEENEELEEFAAALGVVDEKLSPEAAIHQIHATTNMDELDELVVSIGRQLDVHEVYEAMIRRQAVFWAETHSEEIFSQSMIQRMITEFSGYGEFSCKEAIAALECRREKLSTTVSAPCSLEILGTIFHQIPRSSDTGESGCELRAHQICEQIAGQYPELATHRLTKAWTQLLRNRPLHRVFPWKHHVAPCLQTIQGMYVLDPVLFPRGPAKLEDWLGAQDRNIGEYKEQPWEIRGFAEIDSVALDVKSISTPL